MRKLVVAALSLLLLALAAPVPAEPHIRIEERAFATWLIPTEKKHRFIWYFGMAQLHDNVAGPGQHRFAALGRGECIRHERALGSITMCEADRFVRGRVARDFSMGPLVASATLGIRYKGRKQVIRWAAPATEGDVYDQQETCPAGQGVGAGITRNATVTGRMFGRRLPKGSITTTKRGIAYGILQRGAVASQCSFMRSFDVEGDTITASFNF
ncbi:MAG: hypothetical protein ACRDKT_13120 [Actinomycetota bacterium]